MAVKFAILISGRGSNMLALADRMAPVKDKAEITLVASDKSCAGLALAKERGIATKLCAYQGRTKSEAEAELAREIEESGADYILLAGFMRVLSASFVNRFEGRILNIHPSLLPKYKGLNTHQRALDAGDTHHGVSVHLVTAGLDEGPLIAQAAIDILTGDDEVSLSGRLLPLEHALYGAAVMALIDGSLTRDGNAYHWHKCPHISADLGQLRLPSFRLPS